MAQRIRFLRTHGRAVPIFVLTLAFAIACMALVAPVQRAHADESSLAATSFGTEASQSEEVKPGVYYIQSALPGRYMLDVAGASEASGANVQIYTSNKTAAQRWRVSLEDDGTYTICNVASGRYLDVSGGAATSGANVQQWKGNGSAAQRWRMKKSGSTYEIATATGKGSSYVLDVKDALGRNESNVQIYRSNGTTAQKWHLVPVSHKVKSERTIENGVYEMRLAKSSSYAVGVDGSSVEPRANVQLAKRGSSASQRWIVRWKNGYYTVINLASGMALEAAHGGVALRTNVWQAKPTGSAAQSWAISKRPDGSYTLMCKANGLALEVMGGKLASGTNVRVNLASGGAAQRFSLVACKEVLPSGSYVIRSLAGGSTAVDIPDATYKSDARAQVWSVSDGIAQRMRLDRVGPSTFTIRPVCSGLYLTDVKGKVVQRKKAVKAAQWTARLSGTGIAFTNVATGRDLVISGGKAKDGAKLSTTKVGDTAAHRFRLANVSILPDGYYELRNVGAKAALDVEDASSADQANVQVYSVNGSAAQCWKVEHVSGEWYRIINDGSGKALDVAGGSTKARANVQQYTYSGSTAQLWRPELASGSGISFVNKGSKLVLEAASSSNGANVRQNKASGSSNQAWRLVAVESRALSGNAELDAYVREVAKENGYDLWSCFDWMSGLGHVQAFDSDTYWGIVDDDVAIKYALYVMNSGNADCYGDAAMFMWLARACGYDANFRAGGCPSRSSGTVPHGWTEVYIDGQTYVCDPNLRRDLGSYNWYMNTYASAPIEYAL